MAKLIHCSLGRDRAGIVISLMQRLAGASRANVERDYVESKRTVGLTSARSVRKVLRRTRPVRHFLRKVLGLNYWEVARIRRLLRIPTVVRKPPPPPGVQPAVPAPSPSPSPSPQI